MNFAALRSKAFRQASALVGGTLFAQLVTFAASPVLARLYSPAEFGVYGLFVSVSAIIASVASGRYDLAIVLPADERDSLAVAMLALLTSLTVACVIGVVLAVSGVSWGALVNNPSLDPWLWLLPFYVFFVSANQIFSQLNLRFDQFKTQAKVRAGQSVASAGLGVGLAGFGLGVGGLIGSVILAQLIVNCLQIFLGYNRHAVDLVAVTRNRLHDLARRYRKFPIYQVPSTLVETLTAYLPVFVLAPFYGAEVAGYFFMAQSIVRVPVVFLAKAVGEVFRQRATRQYNENKSCSDVYKKTFWVLIGVGFPGFALLAFLAPEAFSLVLGERWRAAGLYAQLMAFMFAMQFVSSPLSAVFIITQRLGHNLFMQLTTFLVVGASFLVGVLLLNDPLKTVALYSVAYSLRYAVQLLLSYRYSKGG